MPYHYTTEWRHRFCRRGPFHCKTVNTFEFHRFRFHFRAHRPGALSRREERQRTSRRLRDAASRHRGARRIWPPVRTADNRGRATPQRFGRLAAALCLPRRTPGRPDDSSRVRVLFRRARFRHPAAATDAFPGGIRGFGGEGHGAAPEPRNPGAGGATGPGRKSAGRGGASAAALRDFARSGSGSRSGSCPRIAYTCGS